MRPLTGRNGCALLRHSLPITSKGTGSRSHPSIYKQLVTSHCSSILQSSFSIHNSLTFLRSLSGQWAARFCLLSPWSSSLSMPHLYWFWGQPSRRSAGVTPSIWFVDTAAELTGRVEVHLMRPVIDCMLTWPPIGQHIRGECTMNTPTTSISFVSPMERDQCLRGVYL